MELRDVNMCSKNLKGPEKAELSDHRQEDKAQLRWTGEWAVLSDETISSPEWLSG